MTREERQAWIQSCLDKYGYIPIMGGSHKDGEESDDDNDDESDDDDDEDEGDDGGSGNSKAEKLTLTRKQLRDRLDRARKNGEKAAADKAAIEQAERDKDLQKQIDLFKPKASKVDELEAVLGEFIELTEQEFDAEVALLPDFLQALAPGEEASALEKKQWIVEKARPALEQFNKKNKKKADDDDDDDEDADKDKSKTAKRGLNSKDSKDRRTKEAKLDDVLKRFRATGQYRKM